MAEHSAGFRVYADATQFERGMANAARSAEQVGQRVTKAFDAKNLGGTLATALGLNLTNIADKIVEPFREAAELAKSMADMTGRAADAQERMLLARMTDNQQLEFMVKGVDRLQKRLEDLANAPAQKSFLAGIIQRGSALDKLFGFSRRADNERTKEIQEITTQLAEQTEKIDKKKLDGVKKVSEDTKKADKEAMEGQKELYKKAEERAELEKKIARAKLKEEEVLGANKKELLSVEDQINRYESAQRENITLTNRGMEEYLGLLERRKELTGEIADSEEKVAKLVEKQKEIFVAINNIGRGDTELSDKELKKKAANLRADIAAREIAAATSGGVFTGSTTQDLLLNPQRANLERLMAEIETRETVRRNVRAFGEDRAFQMFGGSEQRFQDILSGISEDKELARRTADGIAELNNRLKQGIPVVNLNK